MSTELIEDVMHKLIHARKQAGLTQAEIAECMGTKQPVIARWENKQDGSMSLHRIADYAIACGVIPCQFDRHGPFEFHLIPLEDARQCTIAHPQEPLTWQKYAWWKAEEILKEPPQVWAQTNRLTCNRYGGLSA